MPREVYGKIIHLDGGRAVAVGSHPDFPDRKFIKFVSHEGEVTHISLSHEAISALQTLLLGWVGDADEFIGSIPDKHETVGKCWRLTMAIFDKDVPTNEGKST